MKSHLLNIHNNKERSLSELLENCILWRADLEFIKIEIAFLKTLLATYPFKGSIPNLFEKLQLFNKDLENLESQRILIYSDIDSCSKELKKMIKPSKLSDNFYYLTTFIDLTEKVLDYYETYKNLKIKIYEFITGLINFK